MDTIVRLPDPARIDEFLRDRAAVQKLKKALGQAYRALDELARGHVEGQFRVRAGNTTVEGFLAKGDAGDPATREEKEHLTWLIKTIGQSSKNPDLRTHPGYTGVRPLTVTENDRITIVVKTIDSRIIELSRQKSYDTHIANVFGPGVLEEARARFVLSATALTRIHESKGIVIDAMQKQVVWGCGGLTSETRIALPDTLATVSDGNLLLTLVHEMTHAMPEPTKTGDKYYRHMDKFKRAKEQRKLVTADYYAEVFDRILKGDPGEKFVPTDSSEKSKQPGGILALYRDEAQKLVNLAWAMGINMYGTLSFLGSHALKNQSAAYVPNFVASTVLQPADLEFLKNLSRLLGLTIHKRSDLHGKANQVTALDLSIVDNKLNVLGRLQDSLGRTIALPASIKAFEAGRVDEVLRMALLIENGGKERPGLLAKDVDKDIIVIRSLANLNDAPNWQKWIASLTKELPVPMRTVGANAVH